MRRARDCLLLPAGSTCTNNWFGCGLLCLFHQQQKTIVYATTSTQLGMMQRGKGKKLNHPPVDSGWFAEKTILRGCTMYHLLFFANVQTKKKQSASRAKIWAVPFPKCTSKSTIATRRKFFQQDDFSKWSFAVNKYYFITRRDATTGKHFGPWALQVR